MKPPKAPHQIDLSVATIFKIVALAFLLLAVFRFLNTLLPILLLIITAVFFALALNPAVSRITNYLPSANRNLATGIAFAVVVISILAFLAITVPPIFSQIVEFSGDLKDLLDSDNFAAEIVNRYQLNDEIVQLGKEFAGRLTNLSSGLTGLANTLFSFGFNIIAVIFMTFMFLIEGPNILRQLSRLFSDKKQLAKYQRIGLKMYEVITAYVNGQLLIAVIGATVALVVMTILGVPNALAMAGIIALLSLIPLIGVIAAATIVIFSTLLVDTKLALIMLVYFVVYQQIENVTIQPYIQSQKLSLSPLMIFIAAIIGVRIAGIWGALLIIPITGCLKVLVVELIQDSPYYNRYLKNNS